MVFSTTLSVLSIAWLGIYTSNAISPGFTIAPSLKDGALIGVDDNWIEQKNGQNVLAGKGQFVFDYMHKSGRKLVQDGYQLFWKW
jgi:hypothetical protein